MSNIFCIFAQPKEERANMAGRFLILNTSTVNARVGELSKDEYARRLPGHPQGISSICKKPKYTKSQRRKMAERPQVKRFCEVNAEASAIMHNPELRAEWEARHRAYILEAKRRGEYTYPRLWDFIRHMLYKEKTAAEKAVKGTSKNFPF